MQRSVKWRCGVFCPTNSAITGRNVTWLVLIFLSAIIFAEKQPHLARAPSDEIAGAHLDEEKEKELRKALNELRQAIKEYKEACDQGQVGPLDRKKDDECYPPTLQTLLDGIQPPNKKYYIVFLRRIPTDPMTGNQEWGLRSAQDAKDAQTWGGENVMDIYSKSDGVAVDGTNYRKW